MTGWTLIPAYALFALPIADTRSPVSSVTLRWGDHFGVDAAIGADFPLVQWEHASVRVQAGVIAAAFLGFQPGGELTFNFETFDGVFAFPVDVAVGEWAGRVQWGHTSAHFGDGARNDIKRPDLFDTYSREWVQVQASRSLAAPRVVSARAYVGGRWTTHGSGASDPFMAQVGGEGEGPWKVAPYLALDVQLAGESDWQPAMAGQVGARVRVGGRRLRVGLTGRSGPEDTGRLHTETEAYVGMVVGFDATGALDGTEGRE